MNEGTLAEITFKLKQVIENDGTSSKTYAQSTEGMSFKTVKKIV